MWIKCDATGYELSVLIRKVLADNEIPVFRDPIIVPRKDRENSDRRRRRILYWQRRHLRRAQLES